MKKKKRVEYGTVKISASVIKKLRDNKKHTGIPISVFIEKAIDEKLSK